MVHLVVFTSWFSRPSTGVSVPLPHCNSWMHALTMSLLLFLVLHVSVSDCASVPVRLGISEDLESLVSSKILMDRTSSKADLKMVPGFVRVPSDTNIITNDKYNNKNIPVGLPQNKVAVSDPGSEKIENVEDALSKVGIFPSTSSKIHFSPKSSPETISSPLHVAQCRATCLVKFTGTFPETFQTITPAAAATATTTTSAVSRKMNEDNERLNLLPLLRLRRRKRSLLSGGTELRSNKKKIIAASCFQENSDCLACWKSCQLLEQQTSLEKGTSSPTFLAGEPNTKEKLPHFQAKSSQKNLPEGNSANACSLLDTKYCMTGGCQAACSFYERLLTKKGENELSSGSELEEEATAFRGDPVIATRHESVVTIVPGKITWPSYSPSGNDGRGGEVAGNKNNQEEVPLSSPDFVNDSPVVYVVIQEYPDRKWRQIAQTTEQEIGIPKELTTAMKTKLRSVRVLVVGPEGLLSVYSSGGTSEKKAAEKQFSHSRNDGNKSRKAVVVEKGITPITTKTNEGKRQGQNSESDGNVIQEAMKKTTPTATAGAETPTTTTQQPNVHVNSNRNGDDDADQLETGADVIPARSPTLPTSPVRDSVTPTTLSPLHEDTPEPFELRIVSLIHQKSLVIAELKWDETGGNPNQDYLITWELAGGGLKGHLVTDSTSVTLSLWPGTTYQIEVEEFHENLKSDGEQPAGAGLSSPTSLKSYPLTVDTSEASFPMGRPSALLSENEEGDYEEDHGDEDESAQDGSESGEAEEEKATHKSITAAHNMTLALASLAAGLVLVILTVAAVTWTRMRVTSSYSGSNTASSIIAPLELVRRKVDCFTRQGESCQSGCFSYCFPSRKEPQLLAGLEEPFFDDASGKFSMSPFYYVVQLKKKHKRNDKNVVTKTMWQPPFDEAFASHHKLSVAGEEEAPAVAVISSSVSAPPSPQSDAQVSAAAPYPFLRFYHNNVLHNCLPSPLHSAGTAEAIKTSEQGCSSSSSCWLPNATCSSAGHDDVGKNRKNSPPNSINQ